MFIFRSGKSSRNRPAFLPEISFAILTSTKALQSKLFAIHADLQDDGMFI
jgi:hypothetical protein